MVAGGSQEEILNPGLVLLGTRQQGLPVLLRELPPPDGFDPMSQSETLPLSYPGRDRPPVGLRLQVHLADEYQVAQNLNPWFYVDYLQRPSKVHRSISSC
ncbi:unnamed protein product [Schistosoma margrebowiei]|uniref:Uncharacterized protein n=1 Tax=Schistosoma margrebowiei TaxID=48269 RepID=A0A183LLZ8_9TREM|nr:unnamed protein product [Schistosoma margrebowiei]